MRNIIAALTIIPLLAACVGAPKPSGGGAASVPAPGSKPPPQVSRPAPPVTEFRAPKVMRVPGLEFVIGKNSTALANLFGAPRLTVNEGDALKLQFSGSSCVLDVYLYPLAPRAQPTATYVNARRASDGADVDRAACAAALRR